MSGNIPVSRFLFKQDWKVLSEVMRVTPFAGEDFSTSNELVTYLGTEPVCLVISSLKDKSDLVQIATFMKQQKSLPKENIVKIVVINFSGLKQFEKAIQKLGILDLVEPTINVKALKFKIDFWMKSLVAQSKKNTSAELTAKSLKSEKEEEKKALDQTPQWQAAIDCEDDIWLIKNEAADCKKVLGKWLVRFTGPGPYVGQWMEVEGKKNIWRFEMKPENRESFFPEKGNWYYNGDQKPEYVWKENQWLMTGTSFELFHRTEKNEHKTRAKLKDKVLTISKNSEYAKTKEEAILESFDKELVFKKDREAAGENDVIENDNNINTNLEGKGKTDNIEQADLSGKNSAEGDLGGNLEGKTDGEEKLSTDPLEGKVKAGRESGPLSGRTSGEEKIDKNQDGPASERHRDGAQLGLDNKNQEHKTHYEGHNEAQQFDANDKKSNQYGKEGLKENPNKDLLGPASEKHRDGAQLGLDNKNQEHKTHYEGHNEAEKFDPNSNKSNQYGGKSDFHEKPLEDLKGPSPEKHREGAQLSQGNKDNHHETHYKGHNPNENLDAKEKKEKEEQEGLTPRSKDGLDGKSSTDKLESHYKSGSKAKTKGDADEDQESDTPLSERKKREKSEQGDDLNDMPSGKGSTDKIESHYKSGARTGKKNLNDEDSDTNPEDMVGKKKRRTDDGSSSSEEKEALLEDSSDDDAGEELLEELSSNGHSNDKDNLNEIKSSPDRKVVSIAEARQDKLSVSTLSQKLPDDIAAACANATLESVVSVDGLRIECGLQDFFDETFIFETDKSGLVAGSTIKLDMKFNYLDKDTKISIEGKIANVDREADGNEQLTIEIDKNSKAKVEEFMKVYESRQNNINVFLKNVKGY